MKLAEWVGDVPPAYLSAIERYTIKVRKADIEYLIETARKEGFNASNVMDLRGLAEKELFWFAKYVLGYPDFTNAPIEGFDVKSTHGDMCDLYIRKDKTKPFSDQDLKWKTRLLLCPRGSFKSVTNLCDTVQWILNFPDIRILLLTSTRPLSIAFLDVIKSHFVIRTGEPSYMNQLFPEFCLLEKKLGNVDEFLSPMRSVENKDVDPTIFASSVESALSGHHFDLMKCSDIISNENSGTEESLRKATKNFYLNKKMLMQYGYLDLDGTRYSEFDTYGDLMEKNEKTPEDERRLKVLCQPAWRPKPGYEGKEITELERDQVYLLFDHPNFLSFANLRSDYRADPVIHEGQMQQNPRPQLTTVFTKDMLLRSTVPFSALPMGGPISITWDFAFSKKQGRDYTVGSVGQYDKDGRLFIIDLIFGRFKPDELSKAVVKLAKDWNPMVIGIEDVAGSRFLEPAIIYECRRQGLNLRIDWFVPDQKKDAKRTRIAALHPWLVNKQLFFSAQLPYLDELYKQFELCMGSHHHEDIPDSISHQLRYAPRMQMMIGTKQIDTLTRDDAEWNIMFEEGADQWGRIGTGAPPSIVAVVSEDELRAEPAAPEYEPMLGAGLSG